MGAYIEAADVHKRYPLSQTHGGSDELEVVVGYAETTIEGALAPAFTVPFSEAYVQVKDLCVDEVWRRLMMTRDPDAAEEMAKDIKSRVDKLLSGQAALVGAGGPVYGSLPGRGVWSTTMGYKPVFDMRDAEDQHRDPDRLDAEDAADDAMEG